jgi:ribosome-associated protein
VTPPLDPDGLAREVVYTASRSGGPGGQNVNKVSTRVTLSFDIPRSPSLDDGQKRRLLEWAAGRVNRHGILRVTCQTQRSQSVNRVRAWERFLGLLEEAFAVKIPRRETRVPKASRARRLDAKKQRGTVKKLRGRLPDEW